MWDEPDAVVDAYTEFLEVGEDAFTMEDVLAAPALRAAFEWEEERLADEERVRADGHRPVTPRIPYLDLAAPDLGACRRSDRW